MKVQVMLINRKRALQGALALVAIAVGVSSWWLLRADRMDSEKPQAMWQTVNVADVKNTLGLAGRIAAAKTVTLTAPFDGTVSTLSVVAGSKVKAGDVIFTLDTAQLDMRVRNALSDVLKAQREVTRVEQWKSAPEISRLRRQLRMASAQLKNSQTSLAETRALYQRGIVSRNELDAIRLQVETQTEEQRNAQDDLALAEAGADSDNQQIANMALANAQAQYDLLIEQAKRAQVKAPFDGLVLQATLPGGNKAALPVVGQLLTQGSPVFNLAGLEEVNVVARVQESDTRFLKEGLPVTLVIEGISEKTFSGRLTHISVENANGSEIGGPAEYDVVASMNAAPAELSALRLGMSATLDVITYHNPHGITVPPQALANDDSGRRYVIYRRNAAEKAMRVYVQEGHATAAGTEVSGLQAGEVLLNP